MDKFIAIDPSLNNTAIVWGYILDDGRIQPVDYEISITKKSKEKIAVAQDIVNRASQTMNMLRDRIFNWSPDYCFGEFPSGSQSSSAMRSYGVSCCYLAMLPNFTGVTPNEVKKVTGIKNASKDDMMEWAERAYPKFPWERKKDLSLVKGRMEHVADAVAVAVVANNKKR